MVHQQQLLKGKTYCVVVVTCPLRANPRENIVQINRFHNNNNGDNGDDDDTGDDDDDTGDDDDSSSLWDKTRSF